MKINYKLLFAILLLGLTSGIKSDTISSILGDGKTWGFNNTFYQNNGGTQIPSNMLPSGISGMAVGENTADIHFINYGYNANRQIKILNPDGTFTQGAFNLFNYLNNNKDLAKGLNPVLTGYFNYDSSGNITSLKNPPTVTSTLKFQLIGGHTIPSPIYGQPGIVVPGTPMWTPVADPNMKIILQGVFNHWHNNAYNEGRKIVTLACPSGLSANSKGNGCIQSPTPVQTPTPASTALAYDLLNALQKSYGSNKFIMVDLKGNSYPSYSSADQKYTIASPYNWSTLVPIGNGSIILQSIIDNNPKFLNELFNSINLKPNKDLTNDSYRSAIFAAIGNLVKGSKVYTALSWSDQNSNDVLAALNQLSSTATTPAPVPATAPLLVPSGGGSK